MQPGEEYMAHGLHGYAVDLDHLNSAIGCRDQEFLQGLKTRFSSVVAFYEKWNGAHAPNSEILQLDNALELLINTVPEKISNESAALGYGIEILSYHLGEHINLGRAGRSALRDITLEQIHEVIDEMNELVGPTPLDTELTLNDGIINRTVKNMVNEARYPGIGYLKRNELQRISNDLLNSNLSDPPEEWTWYPFLLLFHGALERDCDLITFYY
ncbi:MAG: hypothetical protein CMH54_10335 [Myxococcales bacterium]|nr:hypothetical protein [Myxococcales bacterium]